MADDRNACAMTKDGGFLLPEVINPERLCLTINIPNDPNHLAAFWGSLQVLAYWFSWQRDEDKKGTEVSQVWMEVIQEAHAKFYSENPCEVDVSCIDVAACISSSPEAQQAIRDFILSDPAINQHISETALKITEGQIVGKIIEGSCDNSAVAGKVVAIVERMNGRNEDFLQILEVGTNDEERVAAIIQAIPGLSETPANEIIDIAQDILEDFAENYVAAVTDDWKDDVEEDLYCLAKQSLDCSLTYQQLFEYFQNRVGSGLTVQSVMSNVIQFVLNGDFPTDDLVASGLYAIQLAFILAGKEFNGMSVPTLGSLTRDASPSTKWEEWDECAPANCFTPAWNSYHPAGVLLETTETYLVVESVIDSFGRYAVEGGDTSRTTSCLFSGHEFTAGSFNPLPPFPEGFIAWKPGGVNEEDIDATNYQMCLFSYLSATPFTVKVYLS